MNMFNSSPQENLRKMESKLLSAAVAKENALQVTYRNEIKTREQQDNVTRNEFINKMHEMDLSNERQHEQDTFTKKTDYRDFLLKQMDEKQKHDHPVSNSPVNTTAFCEAFVDPIEKNRMKIIKQKEFKDELDECVRQKNDLKMKIRLEEAAEDEKRIEFVKQQEKDSLELTEKTKQLFDQKEQHKNDVAMMWKSQRTHEMAEREKFIDSASDDVNFENFDESSLECLEIKRRIQARRALVHQMQEKIEASHRKLEEEKKERENLLLELQKEEERMKKLKEEEKQKQIEYNKNLQSMIQENEEKKKLEKRALLEEDKKLTEIQNFADQQISQQKTQLLEKNYNDLKDYLPASTLKKEEQSSLHSRFF